MTPRPAGFSLDAKDGHERRRVRLRLDGHDPPPVFFGRYWFTGTPRLFASGVLDVWRSGDRE